MREAIIDGAFATDHKIMSLADQASIRALYRAIGSPGHLSSLGRADSGDGWRATFGKISTWSITACAMAPTLKEEDCRVIGKRALKVEFKQRKSQKKSQLETKYTVWS